MNWNAAIWALIFLLNNMFILFLISKNKMTNQSSAPAVLENIDEEEVL